MREIINIPINKILCDIEGRINCDNKELMQALLDIGQIEPLTVEGPDNYGNYYLIHGYRRLEAMKSCPEEFPVINCLLLQALTSTKERNALRLLMAAPSKRTINVEYQKMVDAIDDPNIYRKLSYSRRKRIQKGKEIPEEQRILAAKKRLSQEALIVIYNLDCDEEYLVELMERYFNGEIIGEHASAINKLTSSYFYGRLKEQPKHCAIEEAIRLAKFDKQDANLIILREIMRENPHPDLANYWIEYICDEIENNLDVINPSLENMINNNSKERIESLLRTFKAKFAWAANNHNVDANTSYEQNAQTAKNQKNNVVKDHFNKEPTIKDAPAINLRMERHGNILRFLFEKANEVFCSEVGLGLK